MYSPPAASLSAVSKTFGTVRALDGLDLELRQGEVLCLLGPNGAGKTTAISMVAGLLTADAGTVTVAGQPMSPSAIEPKI